MFKKMHRHSFETDTHPSTQPFDDLENRPSHPFTCDLMNAMTSQVSSYEEEKEDLEPETVIAEGVSVSGTISFHRLLRIDGTFEGELLSSGKLIIGPTGSIKANLNLEEAYISGKVSGDIHVTGRLVLRGRAQIEGDITAPLLSVDEGVSINGQLHIGHQKMAQVSDPFEDDHYLSDN